MNVNKPYYGKRKLLSCPQELDSKYSSNALQPA